MLRVIVLHSRGKDGTNRSCNSLQMFPTTFFGGFPELAYFLGEGSASFLILERIYEGWSAAEWRSRLDLSIP